MGPIDIGAIAKPLECEIAPLPRNEPPLNVPAPSRKPLSGDFRLPFVDTFFAFVSDVCEPRSFFLPIHTLFDPKL